MSTTLENWLPPTTPTLARRRRSTIADMIVGIEAGYRATVSGAISYQLSPSHSLCTCVRLVQVHAASFLFVGRESSELAPFRQLPTREDTEGQLLSKHQPLPARLKGKLFSD